MSAVRETDGMMLMLLKAPLEVVPEGTVKKLILFADQNDPGGVVVRVDVHVAVSNSLEKVQLHLRGIDEILDWDEGYNLLDCWRTQR